MLQPAFLSPEELHRISEISMLVLGLAGGVITILNFAKGGKKAVIDGFVGFGRIVWLILTPLHAFWTYPRSLKNLEGAFRTFLSNRDNDIADRNHRLTVFAERLHASEAKLETIRDLVERELRFNGGSSMKDVLSILYADYKNGQRVLPYPTFLCDQNGKNLMVSKAYLDLLDLDNELSLLNLDWRSFMDSRDSREYFDGFEKAVESRASFGGRFRFADPSKGAWSVRAIPMLRQNEQKLLYCGVLRPADEVALELSVKLGFDYAQAPH